MYLLLIICLHTVKCFYEFIGLVGRVFANSQGDLGSIPGRVIPKTLKMVLDTSWLNTQQYKVRIKGKVEQSRERSIAPPLHVGVVTIEKGAFWSPSTTVANNNYELLCNTNNLTSVICLHSFKWICIHDSWINSLLVFSFLNELELICLLKSIAINST